MSSGLAKSSSYEKPTQPLTRGIPKPFADEKAFSSLLADSICESIKDVLGRDVLSILVERGFLDDMANPRELDRQLSSTFGNGSLMLERIIVKGLFQKLRIPYDSTLAFDYAKALDNARKVFFGESGHI